MLRLDQDIKYLQGVGPHRAELLQKELGITTVGDLLEYYPFRHIDRTHFYSISDINGTMPYVQLTGQILSFETQGEGAKKRLIAHFSDGTGVIDLVWFQGTKYITQTYHQNQPYIVFGKPQPFKGRYNIAHPEIEKYEGRRPTPQSIPRERNGFLFSDDDKLQYSTQQTTPIPTREEQGGGSAYQGSPLFRPIYHTSDKMKKRGLTTSAIAKLTATLLQMLDQPLAETLPQYIVERHHLMSRNEAMRQIHYPTSSDSLRHAQTRLKFEELFYVQLNIIRYARDRQRHYRGLVCSKVGSNFNDFYYNHLPFPLTGAQKRVIREIRTDMGSGRQMNRLLQGDVGSGKTLVALMCSLIAVDNGYQACIMAPTEILAEQHVQTLQRQLEGMPVRVELLTGSVKGKRRAALLQDLLTGDIHILVGTHAVIEENVSFSNLGLVIIDEQHRFGVAQRAKLWQKNPTPPHVLVMTATPIPRTLAMTLYGDLDVSVIDELPPGRKPIQTIHQYDRHRRSLNQSIRRQIDLGRQVYIVYPLIKESEKMDMKNLEEGFLQVQKDFPDCKVSKVHGQMKPAEKDEQMRLFTQGDTQILVATTVIEVGVNVPNASVMVIENAERFGLSQLHQLRGRVGRGADQSFCILVSKYELSNDTRRRLQIMVDSTDGFEIAEQDLKLRGPGDLEGTQQSGMAFDLKIANLAKDGILLQMARDTAQQVIDDDEAESNPANAILWSRLQQLRKTNINWGSIS